MSAKVKRIERARLFRLVKKNPRVINQRSFLKRASLVNFKLPITVRLRNSTTASNPNTANLDLGASLGTRAIGLGGSLAGEITFHDSYDGGALGNVDISLNPGPKSLQTTSVPLLWNTDVTGTGVLPAPTIAPTYNLGSGPAGCSDFHGNSPLGPGSLGGYNGVPIWPTQATYDTSPQPAPTDFYPLTPGVDDPARLVNSAAVGDDNNVGPSANPFPGSNSYTLPGGFSTSPVPGDSVLRTTPLSLQIASPGTNVVQDDTSANGPQGSQNIVIGKSGGQANLFGNIPGKNTGIDVTVNLATRINSILRAVDPDFLPLIGDKTWPTTSSDCRQAYTGAVQNYIPGVHLTGSLHISPAITADGKLRIAKATLASPTNDYPHVSLAACIFPYSLYTAEMNNSDTQSLTVGNGGSSNKPTNDLVARGAPSGVNCGSTPTQLVQDAGVVPLNPAQSANGYTTSVDGSRVSVAGDLKVNTVSADILVGDVDAPPASPTLPANPKYLALGDSIAYGYQASKFGTFSAGSGDCSNGAIGANLAAAPIGICSPHFNTGYVDQFAAWLNTHVTGSGSWAFQNEGCPGETSASLNAGYLVNGAGPLLNVTGLCGPNAGGGAGFPYAFLHHNYGLGNTQLQDAVTYLQSHPSTAVVTLNIGANDLLKFMSTCGFPANTPAVQACIGAGLGSTYSSIASNVNTTLTALQAAAPNARYIVVGNYDPYPGVIAIGSLGGDAALAQLNAIVKTVAVQHGARFVDPEPVFNPAGYKGQAESGDIPTICQLTLMCNGPGNTFNPAGGDIHPSDAGYNAIASLIESASGF